MSRTYRNVEHADYLRRPKTQNQRRNWLKAELEIKEELGASYVKGNYAHFKHIPTYWTDIVVKGQFEQYNYAEELEWDWEMELNGGPGARRLLTVEIDTHKNVMRIGRTYYAKIRRPIEPSCYYVPFVVNYRRQQIPVLITPHLWS